jgi:DNA-binding response OmpR family regulator
MGTIAGRRVLVVEDEGIAALALCDVLELAGVEVLGPAATVAKAKEIALASDMDAALLDVNLSGQLSFEVASILRDRGVPIVFLTGYRTDSLPPEFACYTILTKPVSGTEVCQALADSLDRAQREGAP